MDLYGSLSRRVKHHKLQAKGKAVSTKLYDDANIYGACSPDMDRLDHIPGNLISSSLRYTPANGKTLISASAGQKAITYRVCDTGRGPSKRDLERVTEQFYRGDEAQQGDEGYSGLGLYALRQLIHRLGGRVGLSNRKDNGARV